MPEDGHAPASLKPLKHPSLRSRNDSNQPMTIPGPSQPMPEAAAQSPVWVYQTPRSPYFLASALAANRKITQTTDWNKPTAVVNENCRPRIP